MIGGFLVEEGYDLGSLTRELTAMERSARDFEVSWAPMSMFYLEGGGDREIRLSFSNLAPDAIREGIARLARFVADTPREIPEPSEGQA
ncbi:hypothetical protein [Streptomyces adonidis]|uniref:hypothetical protein n=1 Tax=Streptomyces adonidis TaxID=3231367 RepID=UPI0034DB433B